MSEKRRNVPRNNTQYEQLSSEYLVKAIPLLDKYAIVAHQLYNRALYDLRQRLFSHHYLNSYGQLDRIFKQRYKNRELMLYHQLGYVQSAQQTLREVMTIWQAWFKALKAYHKNPAKFIGKPRIPKYLHQGKKHIFYVTNQSAKVKNGYLVIPKIQLLDHRRRRQNKA